MATAMLTVWVVIAVRYVVENKNVEKNARKIL